MWRCSVENLPRPRVLRVKMGIAKALLTTFLVYKRAITPNKSMSAAKSKSEKKYGNPCVWIAMVFFFLWRLCRCLLRLPRGSWDPAKCEQMRRKLNHNNAPGFSKATATHGQEECQPSCPCQSLRFDDDLGHGYLNIIDPKLWSCWSAVRSVGKQHGGLDQSVGGSTGGPT